MLRLLLLPLWLFTGAVLADTALPPLQITQLQPGVFLHTSYDRVEGFGLVDANGLIVVDGEQAYIIDTPWSESVTKELLSWIQQQGYKPAGSIATHSHDDRSAGIALLNALKIPTYASQLTNSLLQSKQKALASHEFTAAEYWLVPDKIAAFYPGGGHTIDNLVVWLPQSQLLFGGCLIKSLDAKTLGYTGEAVIAQWPASLRHVLTQYPGINTVIPGHGNAGDITLIEHSVKLAETAVLQ
jgi:glyoxylase-like metal-dependent hydrolase (beta-lactamase superfamily II)